MSEEISTDDIAESSPAPDAEVVETEAGSTEKTEESKGNKVQERINQLTREKYEARQETANLKARLESLEADVKPVVQSDPPAPNENDFDTDEEFHQARDEHIAEVAANRAYQRLKTENESREQATQASERQVTIQSKRDSFEKVLESKRENFKDFEDVAYGHSFMDLDLAEQIFEMDKGPEVAYHLGSHLDEAERIFALSPVQRARELTKLEYQVQELKPKVVSDAPDAINPLGGGSTSVDKDPDNMSADEWQQWEYNRMRAKSG